MPQDLIWRRILKSFWFLEWLNKTLTCGMLILLLDVLWKMVTFVIQWKHSWSNQMLLLLLSQERLYSKWLQCRLYGPNSEVQSFFVGLGEREVLHCFTFNAGMYSMGQCSRMFRGFVYFQNFLQNMNSDTFVCIWQILSNHGLTGVKRFVSSISTKLCN